MPEFEYEILCHVYRNPGCRCSEVIDAFLDKRSPVQIQDLLALLLEDGYIRTDDKVSKLPERRVKLAGLGFRAILLHDEQRAREKESHVWRNWLTFLPVLISCCTAIAASVIGALLPLWLTPEKPLLYHVASLLLFLVKRGVQ